MKSDTNIAQQKGQAQVNKTKWRTNTAQPKGPTHVNVGKFGFASHTKHTAEATNMDLLHSW